MLVDIVTNNTLYTTNCTNLHPTPTSDPRAKVKPVPLYIVLTQYYYPKISPGAVAPKKELNETFIGFRDLITELQEYAQCSIKMR